MPIDPTEAKRHEIVDEASWCAKDIVLYHLSLGAGEDPCDPKELRYVYDKDLIVLPSYSVSSTFGAMPALMGLPGMDIDLHKVLHGQHDLVVHQPVPESADVVHIGRVVDVWDKRKAAIVEAQVKTYLKDSDAKDGRGALLTTNTFSVFVRGEGNFGGESGPKLTRTPPQREPDEVVTNKTLPQLALLHRLNGDRNPLHVDPEFARAAGFDQPILHGLCSYGIALKAVVDRCLDGDPSRVSRYQCRFSGIVMPGDTLQTRIWRGDDGVLTIEMNNLDRETPVISNAAVWAR